MELKPLIICDLDGTLAIRGDRSPYDYSKVSLDTLNEPVNKIIRLFYDNDFMVYILSGRKNVCKEDTKNWLFKNNVCYDQLLMRAEKDDRPDTVIKRELFDTYIKDKFEVYFVLDDRNRVVDMWRKDLNLLCLQVNYGDF